MSLNDSVVQAQVAENASGEISCSFEESNRIRAILGLKPLNASSKESVAVENYKKKREQDAAAAEAAALEQRIEKAKEKRLLYFKSDSSTLGDANKPGDEDLLSAADWVRRSRTLAEAQKEAAATAAATTRPAGGGAGAEAETDTKTQYSEVDLAGLGVRHAMQDFAEGEHMILTLADTPLLERDPTTRRVTGLHQGAEALENVHMAADERRRDALKRIKRSKQPLYSGYDDDEFDAELREGVGVGVGVGAGAGSRKILAQYDDAPALPKTRFVLGANGIAGSGVGADAGAVSSSQRGLARPQTLPLPEVASDYYSQSEIVAFNKRKSKDKDKIKGESKSKGKEDAGYDRNETEQPPQQEVSSRKRKLRVKLEDNADEETAAAATGTTARSSRPGPAQELDLEESLLQQQQQLQRDSAAGGGDWASHHGKAAAGSSQRRTASGAGAGTAATAPGAAQDDQERSVRSAAYQHAVKAASERSARAFAPPVAVAAAVALLLPVEPVLAVSFARVQRLQTAASGGLDRGALWVANQQSQSQSQSFQPNRPSSEGDGEDSAHGGGLMDVEPAAAAAAAPSEWRASDPAHRQPDDRLVFTSTSTFTDKMQAAELERERERETAIAARKGTAAAAAAAAAAASKLSRPQVKHEGEEEGEEGASRVGQATDSSRSHDHPVKAEAEGDGTTLPRTANSRGLELQPLASSSMAAALSLLKGSGDLGSQSASRLAGRAKDLRRQEPSALAPAPAAAAALTGAGAGAGADLDVKIGYHDEFGRPLTQKEAFRQLNYRFHGIAPGLKAQEKRLRTLEREAAHASSLEINAGTGSMKSLRDVQKATGNAHVTVSATHHISGERDESVAQLALEIHNKRQAWKEKQQQQQQQQRGSEGNSGSGK